MATSARPTASTYAWTSEMSVDECRARFSEAFEAYVHEGARMRDLLLSLDRPTEADASAISEQQTRLNAARSQYEEARCRYVELVLRGFVTPEPI